MEETHRDKQHHHLGEQVIFIFKASHLEEGEDEGEVGVGKDDHCKEGGETSVEDMGTRPEQFIELLF